MVSVTGKQLYFNKQVEILLGYKKEEAIGKSFTKFVPKSEIPKYLSKLKEIFTTKKIAPFETLSLHKDGRHIPVEITGKLIKYNGKNVGIGTIRDITERKKEQEHLMKLNQELNKYFTAIEQSTASIVITNIDGNIEYVNPCFLKMTEYSQKEVIGKNPRVLKSGKTPKKEYKKLWNKILTGNTWHGEFINKTKNGEEYIEKAIISPIKNDVGEITHFVAIKEDISKRKMAETIIKEKTEQQQILINNMPALIYFKDKNLKYVLVNKSFAKLVGRKVEDIIGKTDNEISPKDIAEVHKKLDLEIIDVKKLKLFTKRRI